MVYKAFLPVSLSHDKKALSTILNTLISLIIVAIAAYIFISSGEEAGQRIESGFRKTSCEQSLRAAHQSKTAGFTEQGRPTVPPNCIRDVLVIGEEIIEQQTFGINTIDYAVYNQTIAQAMKEAWDGIGKGQYDPRSNWDTGVTGTDDEEIVFCIVWEKIQFSKDLRRFLQRQYQSLPVPIDYMCSEKISPDSDQTYCEYIWGTSDLPTSMKEHYRRIQLDHGSEIVLRLYKGDLLEGGLGMVFGLNALEYVGASGCPECAGIWDITAVSSNTLFSQKQRVLDSNGNFLRDDDKEIVEVSICDRILN